MAKAKAEKKKAKKKSAKKKVAGEQLPLIDVEPENLKEILARVRIYKGYQKVRLSSLKSETAEKQNIHELVSAANLKPLSDGVIRFECDGKIVEILPRDEVIRIRDAKKTKKPAAKKDAGGS